MPLEIRKPHLGMAITGNASMPGQCIDADVNGNTKMLKVQHRAWVIPHYLIPIS